VPVRNRERAPWTDYFARFPFPAPMPDPASRPVTSANPRPGAVWTPSATRFTLHSRNAERVELCLFDEEDAERRLELARSDSDIWTTTVASLPARQRYGYRVHGPYAPEFGHRFNPAKLLADPCALAFAGSHVWNDALLGYDPVMGPDGSRSDPRDTAALVPKCIVVDTTFDWKGDRAPATPWCDTLIYECHVRGMTMLHPDVPRELRGTYLGLASEPVIEHLRSLGVTAVELLPVHQSAIDRRLALLGLSNYWGYNTIGFYAPDARFATAPRGDPVREFKEMVRRFHAAGIEVLLDVVYNHTAEGSHLGPTLGPRGIDHALWYRLDREDPRRCVDWTGTGNSVNLAEPAIRRIVVESLRYWIEEMHVDGFRFDLATAVGRDPDLFTTAAGLFEELRGDDCFQRSKLIAEPWDLGPRGYQLGHFPPAWSEWNDRYRDTARRFWAGLPAQVPEFASRIAGSSDIFGGARAPRASVNFITCHDGFTLADLVSYERKHNEANGEGNRDGRDDNASRNWGAEGPAHSSRIRRLRDRATRNFLLTLAVSQGVPMLSHGDELGRTQRGNNNAYCHDGPLTWVAWDPDPERDQLLHFARRAFAIRRARPELRRERSFDPGSSDVQWLRADGEAMREADWSDPSGHVLGARLAGADSRGDLLFLFNAGARSRSFALPADVMRWSVLISTQRTVPADPVDWAFAVPPHTFVVLEAS